MPINLGDVRMRGVNVALFVQLHDALVFGMLQVLHGVAPLPAKHPIFPPTHECFAHNP
jgi:hypothetical protein